MVLKKIFFKLANHKQ